MFKIMFDFFINYAKGTAPGRMILHAIIFMVVASWMGIVALTTLNFPMIVQIYDRYQTRPSIDIDVVLTASVQVNTLVAEQRVRLGVDRLYISRFHDGKVDVSGVHFIYFSRVSESSGPGVSREIGQTQNLPLAIFPEMLAPLSQNQCYYLNAVDETVENYTFLTEMGVNSRIVCPIRTVDGKLIGMIGADGVVDKINTEELPQLEASVKTLAGVLGSLLVNQ